MGAEMMTVDAHTDYLEEAYISRKTAISRCAPKLAESTSEASLDAVRVKLGRWIMAPRRAMMLAQALSTEA